MIRIVLQTIFPENKKIILKVDAIKIKHLTEGFYCSIITVCKAKIVDRGSEGALEDNTLHLTMLYDFYGELLTSKQREYYDLYYNDDLSLGEIAEQAGISRQGVWDIIRRAEKLMRGYEDKTGLIERQKKTLDELSEIEDIVKKIRSLSENTTAELADEVLAKLQNLK